MTVLAGGGAPSTWTSEQKGSLPKAEYAVVPLQDGPIKRALADCLRGNDIGAGGRDALRSSSYDSLELVDAWRVENATMWGKFSAERQAMQERMKRHATPCNVM